MCTFVRHTIVNIRPRCGVLGTGRVDERSRAILDDADAIISDLAHWVKGSDPHASMEIAEAFGAALERSASLRLAGSKAREIVLSLTEQAAHLSASKDVRHVGWMLLSVKLELLEMNPLHARSSLHSRDDLLRQLDVLTSDLVAKGTTAIAACESRCGCTW